MARPFLAYLHRHARAVALGIACLTACNVFELVQPKLCGRVVGDLEHHRATTNSVAAAALLLVLAGLGRSTFSFLQRRLLIGTARRIEYDLRNDFFRHLQRMPPSWYVANRTGDLMSRATSDINAVRMVLGLGLVILVDSLNLVGVSLVYMLHTSPELTAVSMAPLLGMPLLVTRFTRAIHTRYEAVQEQVARLSARAQENFSGVRVVKAFAQEASEILGFGRLNDEYVRRALREARIEAPFNPVLAVCAGLSEVTGLVAGGWLVARGEIGLGELVAFLGFLAIATGPMGGFGIIFTIWQKGRTSMGRLQEILSAAPEIADAPDAVTPAPTEVRGALSFKGLTVRHAGAASPALDGVTAEIPAGAFVGVVGPVGAGKSVLLSAVARLVRVPDGRLFLDGTDVNRLRLASLRGAIGMVPQDTFLFSDTVRNNIAFGRPDAAPAEVEAAARIAGIDSEIRELPGGYDQLIGERGVTLSGGQRQRVAIARALLVDPRLLLLDNCLSSVDAETEARILGALRTFLAGRTAIVVSHRVSAVRGADLILVMDRGRIVARGTHAELLREGAEYAWLCRRQEIEESLERVA